MVWLVRLELLESVVPRELLVPMEFQVRRERKEIPELLDPLDSPDPEVFREKLEIRDRWDLRVLRWAMEFVFHWYNSTCLRITSRLLIIFVFFIQKKNHISLFVTGWYR